MKHGHRALVVGGSISGLLAAHLLRYAGWDAIVFERNATNLTGRGAGISTQPQFADILRSIEIAFDDSMGIRLDTVICLDRRGDVILKEPTVRTMSAWSRLYRALLERLPAEKYRLGMQFERVEQDSDGVTAVFSDEVLRLDFPVCTVLVQNPLQLNETRREKTEIIRWRRPYDILKVERVGAPQDEILRQILSFELFEE